MASFKKGFVYPLDSTDGDKIAAVKAKWYYNWGIESSQNVNNSIPYIPMIWGQSKVNIKVSSVVIKAYACDVLLGFNEPDFAQQSNMTTQQAIDLWPLLESTGCRLGSPAISGNAVKDGNWLEDFMNKAKSAGRRVDFIAVHWYAPPNPTSFLKRIDDIYAKYNLPIWITEFSPADWNATATTPTKYKPEDAIAFMKAVIPELEKRDYVERYSWKTRAVTDPSLGFAALFDADGNLTDVGKTYAEIA
jgi:hypothetical protein